MNSVWLFSLLLFSIASATYSEAGHNVVGYWGQGPNKKTLGEYCSEGNMDIAVVSFVNVFNSTTLDYNFGGASLTQTAQDVSACQDLGIKVFLSLGGAVGSYNVSGKSEAQSIADELYSKFGPAGSVLSNVKFDGFDLDIESGSNKGYPNLVNDLRSKFGKNILISAAPQCVYPDTELADTLKKSNVDMAFIQFYNNDCNLASDGFNWNLWKKNAKKFKNKNIKLYIGLPGSSTAANSGYAELNIVQNKTSSIVQDKNFGGFMVWDVTYAEENNNYLQQLKSYLKSTDANQNSTTATSSSKTETKTKTTKSLSSTASASPSVTTLSPQSSSTTSSTGLITDSSTISSSSTDSYTTDSFATDSSATGSFTTDSYSTNSYETNFHATDSYATNFYATASYGTESYGTGTYGTGTYATETYASTLGTSYVTGTYSNTDSTAFATYNY